MNNFVSIFKLLWFVKITDKISMSYNNLNKFDTISNSPCRELPRSRPSITSWTRWWFRPGPKRTLCLTAGSVADPLPPRPASLTRPAVRRCRIAAVACAGGGVGACAVGAIVTAAAAAVAAAAMPPRPQPKRHRPPPYDPGRDHRRNGQLFHRHRCHRLRRLWLPMTPSVWTCRRMATTTPLQRSDPPPRPQQRLQLLSVASRRVWEDCLQHDAIRCGLK